MRVEEEREGDGKEARGVKRNVVEREEAKRWRKKR